MAGEERGQVRGQGPDRGRIELCAGGFGSAGLRMELCVAEIGTTAGLDPRACAGLWPLSVDSRENSERARDSAEPNRDRSVAALRVLPTIPSGAGGEEGEHDVTRSGRV
ncbi:hypothetical protein GCM10008965_55020 [Methylorubrum aminovorans]|nr:hypothetical protein GCM10025880_14640 [Methylorubrum aminovorans]